MSHFNVGHNAQQRRKFIGPQHRLGSRSVSAAGGISANLENIGGRILVESEMVHHKLRMKEVKPSVDTSMPWAHRQQAAPTGGFGASRSGLVHRLREAASDHQGGEKLYPPLPSGSSRPQSAHLHGRPQSAGASAAVSTRTLSPQGTPFEVSSLSVEQQRVYRDMIRVLCSLDQQQCKHLLEHMYREAEDKKLLMAYTGVFPEDMGHATSTSTSQPHRHGSVNEQAASAAEGGDISTT
mmetsp:Transcript_37891/g.44174  ORF Transcript_37891/g.44174 Transcript_37891/m.44174 type:complete len:238 (+) Transcript_37891:43-756(+)